MSVELFAPRIYRIPSHLVPLDPSSLDSNELVGTVWRVTPVANDLESSNHLTNSEKPKHLGADDADLCECCAVEIPDASEEGLRVVDSGLRGLFSCVASSLEEGLRVAEALGKRLDVGLHSLHGTVLVLAAVHSRFMGMGMVVRWVHVAALDRNLAQLTGNLCVVDCRGDHA